MSDAATAPFAAVPLYRYGWLAWFWRPLLLAFAALGAAMLLWLREQPLIALAIALPLLTPAAYFGCVVATAIDRVGDRLHVRTLSGWRRTIALARLGTPKRRTTAYNELQRIHAPRLWQPVRGGVAIYLDLLATIPDRAQFERVFGKLPNR